MYTVTRYRVGKCRATASASLSMVTDRASLASGFVLSNERAPELFILLFKCCSVETVQRHGHCLRCLRLATSALREFAIEGATRWLPWLCDRNSIGLSEVFPRAIGKLRAFFLFLRESGAARRRKETFVVRTRRREELELDKWS